VDSSLLADQFGIEIEGIEWITLEEGHVAGVTDPPTVRRDTSGADLMSMLRDGAVDAVIVDPIPIEPRFVPVVRDPEATFLAWQQERGAQTINHVVAVRDSLAGDQDAMRELFRLFGDSREAAGDAVDPKSVPLGLASIRRSLEVAVAIADEQRLLAGPLTVDDLVTPVLASLD
jgi:4,5-dihydroxyphthalate decarboxylase